MKSALISLESKSSLMTIEAMKKYFDTVDSINIKNVEVTLGSKDLHICKRLFQVCSFIKINNNCFLQHNLHADKAQYIHNRP